MELEKRYALRLLNYGATVLVTSKFENKESIITLAWTTPVSHSPPLLAISIGKERFTHNIIKNSGEFAVNLLSLEMLNKIVGCGSVSGKDIDKFRAFSLQKERAKYISSPLIKESFAFIECKVDGSFDVGDHTLFIGRVLRGWIKDEYWKKEHIDIEKIKTVHHLGGCYFTYPSKELLYR